MHLSFLIVGSGYRAKFYGRIARTYPTLFSAMFLCRSEEKAALMLQETGVPAVLSVEEAEAFRPDFVVVAVNKTSITDVCIEWVNRGYPVLMETPAGMTEEHLLKLWDLWKAGAQIAVAEQYCRYPDMIAGLQAIAAGRIGIPGTAYLSLAHDYHGMSLLRRMLMTEGESYVIRGERTMHPVVETDSRTGPIPGNPIRERARDVVWVSFDSGKNALYDFSGVQYHSFIRSRHVLVRGDRGEWCDTILYCLDDDELPVREELAPVIPDRYRELDTALLRDARRVPKRGLSMDNLQDEFAMASMLYDMKEFLEKGTEVYPFRDALEDAYFRILMEKALAEPWKEVRAGRMPWMQ